MQQFFVFRVGVLADSLADPALDAGELLVAGGQRTGGHQDGAQVLDGFAGRQVIQRGVAERAPPVGELGEHRPYGGVLEPVQHGGGPSGAGQGVVQHPQLRADLPAGAGEELTELAAQLAAAADPGQQPLAGAAGRAGLPETLIRDRAAGAQRRLAGAGPDGGQLTAARAFRLPAGTRAAPRLPGGLGHHARDGPPDTLQDAIFRGMHDAQTGPSAQRVLTRRRRPQRAHSSRLTGLLTRQFGHSGLPSASRVAGSRAVPQRLHGTAPALATQLRQLHWPCKRRCRRTTRPQCGQAGRVMFSAPAAHSSSISRSTAAAGACAPSPVSSAGRPPQPTPGGADCPAGRTPAGRHRRPRWRAATDPAR